MIEPTSDGCLYINPSSGFRSSYNIVLFGIQCTGLEILMLLIKSSFTILCRFLYIRKSSLSYENFACVPSLTVSEIVLFQACRYQQFHYTFLRLGSLLISSIIIGGQLFGLHGTKLVINGDVTELSVTLNIDHTSWIECER